ncbi:putative Zn-dependent protease [Bradyrhizobium japonicum]
MPERLRSCRATGDMQFDTADLSAMEADGTLNDVIMHEMGHVIGIGTILDEQEIAEG